MVPVTSDCYTIFLLRKNRKLIFWNEFFSDFDSQKSSEERVAELEKIHKKELATKDQELNEKLQAQEKVFQEKMKAALVSKPKMC